MPRRILFTAPPSPVEEGSAAWDRHSGDGAGSEK
jgi:hypothetical protein